MARALGRRLQALLDSYRVDHASSFRPRTLEWMASLPISARRRPALLRACRRAIPTARCRSNWRIDLLWIREPFLSHEGGFGRLVVHGHTPLKARVPDLRANRLNIDTGAGYGGPIAAAIFDDRQRDPLAFLTNAGEIRMETATHG